MHAKKLHQEASADSLVSIVANNLSVVIGLKTILNRVSFTIRQGQAWAMVGPSGSGKSTLAQVLARRLPISSGELKHDASLDHKIGLVDQQHRHRNQTDASATYYQARYESLNDEEFPTVAAALQNHRVSTSAEDVAGLLELLRMSHLQHTRVIQLSNGENKRFQLAKALLQQPRMLILDNPFVGLDQANRRVLHRIINQLSLEGRTIVLITSPTEIPECITHVMELHEGRVLRVNSRDDFLHQSPRPLPSLPAGSLLNLKGLEDQIAPYPSFEVAIRMQNVTVRYSGKTILNGVNWQVNRGDKWTLTGANGAGKSTLLSLVNGDNPQAYANEIYLFDQKKGSGESIWDIKRRIGYVSPELHLYVNRRQTCFKTVASGLTDTMVYDKRLSEAQRATVDQWLTIFRLTSQRDVLLGTLPLGEQRRVLLARAMVKNPPVLILDEPCQGLDAQQTEEFRTTVDALCRHFEKTLIYVSHHPADIPECVDRELTLREGKVYVVPFLQKD